MFKNIFFTCLICLSISGCAVVPFVESLFTGGNKPLAQANVMADNKAKVSGSDTDVKTNNGQITGDHQTNTSISAPVASTVSAATIAAPNAKQANSATVMAPQAKEVTVSNVSDSWEFWHSGNLLCLGILIGWIIGWHFDNAKPKSFWAKIRSFFIKT